MTASVFGHTQASLHPLNAEAQQFLIVFLLDLQALHIAQCHCLLERAPVCIMLPIKQSILLIRQGASMLCRPSLTKTCHMWLTALKVLSLVYMNEPQ